MQPDTIPFIFFFFKVLLPQQLLVLNGSMRSAFAMILLGLLKDALVPQFPYQKKLNLLGFSLF